MANFQCRLLRRSSFLLLTLAVASFVAPGCAEPDERIPPGSTERYKPGTKTDVHEPYPTTTQNYSFSRIPGTMKIADLLKLFDMSENFSWYGLSQVQADRRLEAISQCGPHDNTVAVLKELPATIQGIVTYHPRYFKKTSFCGFDSRNYGSFWIQDETGGIMVTRDTRIADFDIGDEITLDVNGIALLYQVPIVIMPDNAEIVEKDGVVVPQVPIYTQEVSIADVENHLGEVVTVKGKVVVPPTNYNFNSVCMVPVGGDTSACELPCLRDKLCKSNEKVYLSVDREIGQRNPYPIEKGAQLTVTGPVTLGYSGTEIAIGKIGQYKIESEKK